MVTDNIVDFRRKTDDARTIVLSVGVTADGKLDTACEYVGFTPLEAIAFLESAKLDIYRKMSS